MFHVYSSNSITFPSLTIYLLLYFSNNLNKKIKNKNHWRNNFFFLASRHTTITIGHQHFTNELRRSPQCFVYHIWWNAVEKVPKKNHQTLLQRFVQFLVNHQASLPYIYFSIIQDLLEFIYIYIYIYVRKSQGLYESLHDI